MEKSDQIFLHKARKGQAELESAVSDIRGFFESIANQIDDSSVDVCVNESMNLTIGRFETFKGETDKQFYAWVRTITRNVCIGHLRKQKANKEVELGEHDPPAEGKTVSQEFRKQEEKQQLLKLLGSLSEDEREAIMLRYFEGWENLEIAELLDRSPSAIGGLVFRGLKKLGSASTPSQWSQLLGG